MLIKLSFIERLLLLIQFRLLSVLQKKTIEQIKLKSLFSKLHIVARTNSAAF